MGKKRASERLFERYWAMRGFPTPAREPRPGHKPSDRGPDYGVPYAEALHLFEIKDLDAAGNPPVPPPCGPFEPCAVVRKLIHDAVAKFGAYRDHPCYAVLAGAGRWLAPLWINEVAGAAFGSYGLGGVERGGLLDDRDACKHPVPMTKDRRTHVRGVVVLRRRLLTTERAGAAVAEAARQGDWDTADRLLRSGGLAEFGPEEELPRLVVVANPFGDGIPEGLFRGRGDACYELQAGRLERVWAGPDAAEPE